MDDAYREYMETIEWPEEMPQDLRERFMEPGPVRSFFIAMMAQFDEPEPARVATAVVDILARLISDGYAILSIPEEVAIAARMATQMLNEPPDTLPN